MIEVLSLNPFFRPISASPCPDHNVVIRNDGPEGVRRPLDCVSHHGLQVHLAVLLPGAHLAKGQPRHVQDLLLQDDRKRQENSG